MIKKYITASGIPLAVGDYYGAGEEELVTLLEEEGSQITITTNQSVYHATLKPGDYISYEDGSAKIVKSKFDKQDE